MGGSRQNKLNTFFGIYYTAIIQTEIKNEKRAKSS